MRPSPRSISSLIAVAAALMCVLWTPAASGHASLVSSDPPENSSLDSPPKSMSLTFSETPAVESKITVKDGCKRNVAGDLSVSGKTIELSIVDPQPGRWTVKYKVLSAEDGHEIAGDYLLEVAGQADCSGSTKGSSAAGGEDDDGSGSSAPILLLVGGAAVLAVIALLVRRSGSR